MEHQGFVVVASFKLKREKSCVTTPNAKDYVQYNAAP